MFCGECGVQNPDTNQFCKNCGKPLTRRQPGAQPAIRPAATPSAVTTAPSPPLAIPPASAATAAPAGKPGRNWTGIASLICGILSWIILTTLLAVMAIIIGGFSLYKTRKETGKIAFSAVAAIVIAIAAMAVILIIR